MAVSKTVTVTSTSSLTMPSNANYTISGNLLNHNFGNLGMSNITNSNTLEVRGDANFDGDIKWKGRSLGAFLEEIESRLAILVPDPAKLEQFEALKKAYDHYKLMEKLCQLPGKNNES